MIVDLVTRASLICDAFTKSPSELQSSGSMEIDRPVPMATLVSKLHSSLNKLEKFPVIINEMPGIAGLKVLTQPFKLKLSKGNDITVTYVGVTIK